MPLLIYIPSLTPPGIGGIDEYTVLMLHADGDQSDSSHTITHNGNPQFSTAQSKFGGSSMYFNGSSYLSAADSSDWDFGAGDFTIDFWIRFASLPASGNTMQLVSQYSTIDNSRAFAVALVNVGGTYYIRFAISPTFDGTGLQYFDSEVSITTGVWYHLAAVRKNGNTGQVFLDGVSKNTGTMDITVFNAATPLTIGCRDSVNYLDGYIDELRISKGIARWTSDFSSSLPTSAYTSDANTKLLLHFDGDVSTSAHTIISNGNPQLSAAMAKFDGSMYFDGSGDYLYTTGITDEAPGTGNYTFDGWIYYETLPTGIQRIMSVGRAGLGLLAFGIRNAPYRIALSYLNTSCSWSNWYSNDITANLTTETWHHIAAVRDGSTLRFFLNGNDVGTDNDSTNLIISGDGLRIGCSGKITGCGYGGTPDEFFNGYVDELRYSVGIARWTSNFTPESGPYTT